jgi:hypothetical protein
MGTVPGDWEIYRLVRAQVIEAVGKNGEFVGENGGRRRRLEGPKWKEMEPGERFRSRFAPPCFAVGRWRFAKEKSPRGWVFMGLGCGRVPGTLSLIFRRSIEDYNACPIGFRTQSPGLGSGGFSLRCSSQKSKGETPWPTIGTNLRFIRAPPVTTGRAAIRVYYVHAKSRLVCRRIPRVRCICDSRAGAR